MQIILEPIVDKDCLVAQLSNIDISVSSPEMRTNDQRERYTILRLLSTLAECDRLVYPLSLFKRERPDYLLTMGESEIGLEVTESTNNALAQFRAYASKKKKHYDYDSSYFKPGQTTLTRQDMESILSGNRLTSRGWCGDQVEREWSEYITDSIEKKTKKLTINDYQKYDKNWLAIYANLPLPDIHFEVAKIHTEHRLREYFRSGPCFDHVFVQYGQELISISKTDFVAFSLVDFSQKSPVTLADRYSAEVSRGTVS